MTKYLIFGGTGSLGKKLILRLMNDNEVVISSRDEGKHFTIRNDISNNTNSKNVRFVVGDIRDLSRVRETIRQVNPDRIIVASALKQVETCELSPNESVATNIVGTQNIITAIQENIADKLTSVLFVSTDKACQPCNVYGMCKSISERLITCQSLNNDKIRFLCTRYGNVLESRGSIIPLFRHQAEHSTHFTVTDPNMTRFLMTLDESVDLILHAFTHGKSGDTWIPKLKAMRIGDLANIFSQLYDKKVNVIGERPGEKQHEDLISETESVRTNNVGSHYVILPSYSPANNHRFSYKSSDSVLTQDELKSTLTKLGILDMSIEKFIGSSIEEIMTNRK